MRTTHALPRLRCSAFFLLLPVRAAVVSCHRKAFAVCVQHNGVWGDRTGTWQSSVSTCVRGTSGVLRVQEGEERLFMGSFCDPCCSTVLLIWVEGLVGALALAVSKAVYNHI